MIHPTMQAYPDGVAIVSRVSGQDRTDTGIVIDVYTHIVTVPYERRTVGVQRYWWADRNDRHIADLIRCPLVRSVDTQCVAEIDGKRYQIVQVQYPQDTTSPTMDLSLEVIDDGSNV